MKNKLEKKVLEAIAEAPEGVREDWSSTQRFIAQVVEDIEKEVKLKGFDGDVNDGTH